MAKTAVAKKAEQPATRKASGHYDVHPGVAMMQKWIGELKEKTGRSVEEWIALTQKEGPASGHKARVEWLKKKHKMGNNSAWWIAERAGGKGWDEDSPEAYFTTAEKYVEQQYSGKKAELRAIYDKLLKLGKSVADDVKACPCQTMVPLYRNHVFAQIKPTTNSRIDLGFALAKYRGKLPKRLIDTGGLAKKDRITHRIEITEAGQIDDDVRKWVKTAYELDAE
ncbi:MAG: DUF4287 domain-containing protein [Acidobacteria bacterium]|nr:DUF4287 domain-containing protein [Acidobacteriota bacterium]